ncbi:hypothetical protein Tco_0163539, partial [Tanacetum coccineum]
MHPGKSQTEHIDEFHKLVGDLAAIDNAISDKDQALLLLTSLPSYYDNFVETLLYGRDTMKLEVVVVTLNSRELQKMTEAKGDGGEWFYVRGRSGQRDAVCGQSHREEAADSGVIYGMSCTRDRQGLSTYEGWVKFRVGQRQVVTRKTLKGRKQLEEYQTGWKIKTDNVLDFLIRVWSVQGFLSKVFWTEDTTMSAYLVNRSPSSAIGFKTPVDMLGFLVGLLVLSKGCLNRSRNMGFNESGEYKKTFIGSGVAGSQEVQTQDLIFYHLGRDREQHSTHELFSYREDSNETASAVAAVDKIYAHESLTFNNIVACK